MRRIYLLLLYLAILQVQAQRRTTSTSTESSKTVPARSQARNRGRSRFELTGYGDQTSTTEQTLRRISPRKRIFDETTHKNKYEVQEIVNESPIDPFKRQSKPRIISEDFFDALSSSKSEETSSVTDTTKVTETLASNKALSGSSLPSLSTESLLETYTTAYSENLETPAAVGPETQDIMKSQPLPTTQKTTQETTNGNRRSNVRSKSDEVTTYSSRSRSRLRTSEVTTPSPVRTTRASRRRVESSTDNTRRGPSVFDASNSEIRSRSGRRIDTAPAARSSSRERPRSRANKAEASLPEKFSLDIPKETPRNRFSTRIRGSSEERRGQRRQGETTTIRTFTSRSRFRSRATPPVIDEQKLEVLPLFESEPKTVEPPTAVHSKARGSEKNDLKPLNKSEEDNLIKPSRRTSRVRNDDKLSTESTYLKPEVSSQVTVNVETRTEATIRRRKPQVKESVVSKITEVTSKRVITRKKNAELSEGNDDSKPKTIGKIITRGRKKSEIDRNDIKKSDDDDVDESDNYPEQFKALIQAKKGKKEPRLPSDGLKTSTSAAPVVVTSIVTSSSSASAEVTKEYQDLINELVPKTSSTTFRSTSRPVRNRFSLTTQTPGTTSTESTRSTRVPYNRSGEKPVASRSSRPSSTFSTTAFPSSSNKEYTTTNSISSTLSGNENSVLGFVSRTSKVTPSTTTVPDIKPNDLNGLSVLFSGKQTSSVTDTSVGRGSKTPATSTIDLSSTIFPFKEGGSVTGSRNINRGSSTYSTVAPNIESTTSSLPSKESNLVNSNLITRGSQFYTTTSSTSTQRTKLSAVERNVLEASSKERTSAGLQFVLRGSRSTTTTTQNPTVNDNTERIGTLKVSTKDSYVSRGIRPSTPTPYKGSTNVENNLLSFSVKENSLSGSHYDRLSTSTPSTSSGKRYSIEESASPNSRFTAAKLSTTTSTVSTPKSGTVSSRSSKEYIYTSDAPYFVSRASKTSATPDFGSTSNERSYPVYSSKEIYSPFGPHFVNRGPALLTTASPFTEYSPNGRPALIPFSSKELHSPAGPHFVSRGLRFPTGSSSTSGLEYIPGVSSSSTLSSTNSAPTTTSPVRGTKLSNKISESVPAKYRSSNRSSYRSKLKKEDSGSRERISKTVDEPVLLSTKMPISKTDRYRSDLSSRPAVAVTRSTTAAPVYIPTIPSAPYVPTVPTVTPPTRTTTKTVRGTKDVDLGMEVIFFDDPVNTIPSANLVQGDYVSSTANSLNIPPVKGGTTEKAVSIIERIINSITAISTSPSPSTTNKDTTSTTEPSKSAILKLASKKTKSNNSTDVTDTLHTEKPTVIIEQILNSLSAIQATDDTNSVQVGKDFNTISSSSTTPLPSNAIRFSRSRPTTLEHFSTSISPLSVLDEITPDQVLQKRTIGKLLDILNGLTSTHKRQDVVLVTPKASFVHSPSVTTPLPFTSRPLSTTTTTTTASTSTTTETTTTEPTTQFEVPTTLASLITESISTTAPTPAETTTILSSSEYTTQYSDFTSTLSAQDGTSQFPTTLSYPHKFKVSPDSVKVSSANDPFNVVTSDDNLLTTVTIPGRPSFENIGTTQSTTTVAGDTTTVLPETTTTDLGTTMTSGLETTTAEYSNVTDTVPSLTTPNRFGKLLGVVQDPVSNSIDASGSTTSTTPDYFVFAVLNNNTILRKKPPTVPNKDTPFVIVGVYPNNTIVRKFPNGTIIPMDPILRDEQSTTASTDDAKPRVFDSATSFQPYSTYESTTNNRQIEDVVYRIPPRNRKNYVPETSTNTFGSINFTTSTGVSVLPGVSETTTISSVVQIPESTVTTLDGFREVEGASTTTTTTTTATASTVASTAANYKIIPFNQFNQVLNIQDLIRGDDSTSREQVVTVRPINADDDEMDVTTGSTTTTKVPLVPKVPPTKSTTPQTIFVEEIITVPSVSVDLPTTALYYTTTVGLPTSTILASSTSTEYFSTPNPNANKAAVAITPRYNLSPTTSRKASIVTTTTAVPRYTSSTTTKAPKVSSTTAKASKVASTTAVPFLPPFLTTFFPSLFTPEPTRVPKISNPNFYTTESKISSSKVIPAEIISFAATTSQPSTVASPARKRTNQKTTSSPPKKRRTTTTTTTPTTTTTKATTTTTTTEKVVSSTTKRSVDLTDLNTIAVTSKPTKKKLTEEQKKNLETLLQLEREQAALLQQLSFLTSLNFGGNNKGGPQLSNPNLASKVAELAKETVTPTTSTSSTTTPTTKKATKATKAATRKPPASIQDQLASLGVTTPKSNRNTPSLDEVLKQYDLDGLQITTKAPVPKYGTSSDAILASILKEQGIAPPTPKVLAKQLEQAGVFEETTKRPKPRPKTTTTQRPRGGLLNWLLNAFAPPPTAPPTRRPKAKAKPSKPKKPPVEQELLANSPTHVTPIVTTAPKAPSPNSLSQDDIQKLIKQLEGLQKDPKGQLDLSQVKSLQNLINNDGPGVEVLTNGEHGTTSRHSTTKRPKARKKTTTTTTTEESVSEADEDDEEFSSYVTTSRARQHTVAPLGFSPVPGVDEDGPGRMIRSNLLTAAVNVTRAMAGFLGTAIQGAARGAAQGFQTLIGSGSRLATNYAQGSSAGLG